MKKYITYILNLVFLHLIGLQVQAQNTTNFVTAETYSSIKINDIRLYDIIECDLQYATFVSLLGEPKKYEQGGVPDQGMATETYVYEGLAFYVDMDATISNLSVYGTNWTIRFAGYDFKVGDPVEKLKLVFGQDLKIIDNSIVFNTPINSYDVMYFDLDETGKFIKSLYYFTIP